MIELPHAMRLLAGDKPQTFQGLKSVAIRSGIRRGLCRSVPIENAVHKVWLPAGLRGVRLTTLGDQIYGKKGG